MGLTFSQPEVRFPPGANPNVKRCKSNQNSRMPINHRNRMAAEALDNSAMLLKHGGHDYPTNSDYHMGARMALQTQMRNRHLHTRTSDRKSRVMQGLGPMGLELPSRDQGHQRTHTAQ